MSHLIRRAALALSAAAALTVACDSQPPAAPVTTQPTAADLDALRRSVSGSGQSAGTRLPPATVPPSGDLPAGHPPIPGAGGTASSGPATTSALKFDAAPTWQAQTPANTMRQAQYLLPRAEGDSEDGELILFYFGEGQGGGVENNLQRWREMFTTADGKPLPDEAVVRETFEANGLRVTLLDVAGRYAPMVMPGQAATPARDAYRMVAAVVETPRGNYFFRATGPIGTIAVHRSAIRQMLTTVRF